MVSTLKTSSVPEISLKEWLYAEYIGETLSLATPLFKQGIILGLCGPSFQV